MTRDWLQNSDILAFMEEHHKADLAALALKKPPRPEWPYHDILAQMAARRKAAGKVPGWLKVPGMGIPPADTMEQASSLPTARYKTGLVSGKTFIDLTCGAGVDSWAFASNGWRGVAVERDEALAETLAHNFGLLCPGAIDVKAGAAEDVLSGLAKVDLILLDPQRREAGRKGLYRFEDGSPNVLELLPVLREKARFVLLKTGPLLDIATALSSLPCVAEVHCVEAGGECKEVLYLLDFEVAPAVPVITASMVDEDGKAAKSLSFKLAEEQGCAPRMGDVGAYVFEPGPAFLKAGAFKLLAERHGLHKLAAHTHLYTGGVDCPDFPGRRFKVAGLIQARKEAVKAAIPAGKANLAIRNFPGSVAELRKKLHLAEGGDDYIFACTLESGAKTLVHARKV